MSRKTEDGGIACGACGVSLQEASYTFGLTDVCHGILGVAVVTTMIIKQEGDKLDRESKIARAEKATGYNQWLKDVQPWILELILAAFVFQIALGIILSLGAAYRNSFACTVWLIIAFFTTPFTPITFNLIVLGRLFQYVAVLEFVMKMDVEETRYSVVERRLDFRNERDKRMTNK